MDLAFLNTAFLFGALGAAVPLILHLIKRQRARARVFSMVRFLKQSQRAMVRQQKLFRLLLLITRMAICALLAVVFSRPFIQDSDAALFTGVSDPESVAIVLDTSLSMGFGNRFARAQRQVNEILSDLRGGDHIALITFNTQARTVQELGPNLIDLRTLVSTQLQTTHKGTNYAEALRAADHQLSRSAFSNRRLYLVSDFQQSGWSDEQLGWRLSPGVQLRIIDVGQDQANNVAIMDVAVPGAWTDRSRPQEVVVRMGNFGQTPFKDDLVLFMNDEAVATRQVFIPPKSIHVESIETSFNADFNAGKVQLGADDLPVDNWFYFTVNTDDVLRVLCIEERVDPGQASDAAYYISQALSLRRNPPIKLEVRTTRALSTLDLSAYQVVISANTVALSEEARRRLDLYVREGGSLLIGMNPDLSPELFHTSFRELLPGRIRAVSPSRVDRDQFRLLTEVKDLHPIFQPFAGPRRGDFSAVRFFKTAQLEADSSALVLGNFDDGTIALAEKQIEAGRSLLFLSTFDLTWNDLPIREVFVPFLYEMVDYLAGSSGRNREETRLYSRIGEAIRLPAGTRSVVTPDDETTVLDGPVDPSETLLTATDAGFFTETHTPGLYTLQGTGFGRKSAVNLDNRESDLTRLDVDALAASVINPMAENPDAQLIASARRLAEDVEVERRQKLWWFLSVIVLTLLIGETLLANRTHR